MGTIILGYFWIHMLGTTFLDILQYSESDFLMYYILHWAGQPPYYLGIFIIQKKYNVTDFLQRGRNKAGGWTGGGAWLYQASISNFRTIKDTNRTKQWKYNNNKKQNMPTNGNIITDTASPVFQWNLQDKLAKVLSRSPGGVLIVNWLTILSFEFLTIW